MGITRGANIVQDDLVFGYDTGYGVADNATSTRFYPGETTENLIYDMGGTVTSAYPEVVYQCTATETNVTDATAPGGKYSRFTGNGASSNQQLYSRFSSYSIDVRGDSVNYSVYLKGTGTCHLTIYDNQSGYGTSSTITLTSDWVRYNYTRTVSASATGYWVAVRGVLNTTDVYVAGQQATRNTHATPYVENNRSATQSLIDLTRTTNIDVSNVSFDSTGQPEFDGTDDKINGPNFNLEAMVDSTLEAIIYMDDLGGTDNSYSIFGGVATGNRHGYHEIRNSGSGWKMTHWTSSNGWRYANTALSAGKYYHVVWVWNGLKLYWYLNGVADGDYTYTTFSPYSLGFTTIGSFGTERYMDGKIPVAKLYQKGLSAEEVKQNFNAYKNRFNI